MHSKVKLLLSLLFLVVLSYGMHLLLYRYTSLGDTAKDFAFTLNQLYLFFGISAFILVGILAFLPPRFIDNLGFVFIWLTLVKMGITYWVFHSIIGNSPGNEPTEKMQVFLVFAWFLAIETIFSTRILNNTQ